MSEPTPTGPILRRTFGPETTRLRVLSVQEERRRARRRYRSRLAVAFDLDRRLAALGYADPPALGCPVCLCSSSMNTLRPESR